MKILYHFRTRGIGAEAVHIAGIATAFEKLGHQVDFSSPSGIDPRKAVKEQPAGPARTPGFFDAIANHFPALLFELVEIAYNLAGWWRNARLLRGGQYGFIYERHAFFLFSTAILARQRGVPLVLEVNELVGDERVREQPVLSRLVRICDRFVFRRASLIVVVAPHIKRRIEAMGIDGGKVIVQYNGVSEEDFAKPACGEAVRRRYAIGDAVILGFIGWLSAWHRLEMLIEVFAQLRRQQLNVRLMIVGEGAELGALTEQARRSGVLGEAIFTGRVSHAEIPAHIAAMDVGVVPHSNEYRSPIKLFEYMGQGKAVVVPRTEPIADVVRNGENGLLFEPGSADELRAALTSLVTNAALRARLGGQARRDVLEHHTWSHNACEVEECLFPGTNKGS